jgi:CIC family chloride channel protein
VVAAGTHAPITAILIIFELTADYKIILPLMISCIIATLLATRLQTASIYTLKLLRRGVDVHAGRAVSVLRHILVRDEMRTDVATVRPGEPLMPVISKFSEHPGISIFVVGDDRRLLGVITANQIRAIMNQPSAFAALIIAEDMMDERGFPAVAPTDTLADVMRRLQRYRGEVPVLEDGRLIGTIWPEDVIVRYNAEVFKREMAFSMASSMSRVPRPEAIPAAEGTSMVEVPVPGEFVGQTLGGLDVRNRFGVTVLLVKQRVGAGEEVVKAVPDVDYVFQPGDELLVMGPNDRLRAFERLVGLPTC